VLGRTHAIGGFVSWQFLLPALVPMGWEAAAGGAAFAVWGAYGPDMDHAKATWAQSFYGGTWVAGHVARAVGGHRMGTHCLLSIPVAGFAVGGLLAVAALFVPEMTGTMCLAWALCFAVGWASHILLDSPTVMGCAWFYPFSRRKFRIGNLRVSSSKRNLNTGERRVTLYLIATGMLLGLHFSLSLLGGSVG
jgi:membrane-bound metal-dependent hydrolase YbcI (DUF457 family)